MENSFNIRGSDELKEMYCESCYKDGIKDISVDGFCVECAEYLCSTCVRYHKKLTQNHIIQDKYSMPLDFCFEHCVVHPDELIKFYCNSCDVSACSACKFNTHSGCNEVHHLPRLASQYETSKEFKALNAKLNETENELNNIRKITEANAIRCDGIRKCVKRSIENHKDQLNEEFNIFQADINKTADRLKREDEDKIQAKLKQIYLIKSDLAFVKTNLEKAVHGCALFIESKKAKKYIESMESKITKLNDNVNIREYIYEPKATGLFGAIKQKEEIAKREEHSIYSVMFDPIKSLLVSFQGLTLIQWILLVFGVLLFDIIDVTDVVFQSLRLVAVSLTSGSTAFLVAVATFVLYTLRHTDHHGVLRTLIRLTDWFESWRHFATEQSMIDRIDIKTSGDTRNCNITGLCFLFGDYLVIVDNHNNTLKVVDTKQKYVISILSLTHAPWDIAKVSSETVAVTFPNAGNISYFQLNTSCVIEKRITVTCALIRTIKTFNKCYGIVSYNEKLVISYGGNRKSVDIIDEDGTILQRFTKDFNGDGLFVTPLYITKSLDATAVYISDFNKNTVIKLALDGKDLAVGKYNLKSRPQGITIDETGSLYVCKEKCIYRLSPDLRKGQKWLNVGHAVKIVEFCGTRKVCVAPEKVDTIYVVLAKNIHLLNEVGGN